jgi:hypothetical protein
VPGRARRRDRSPSSQSAADRSRAMASLTSSPSASVQCIWAPKIALARARLDRGALYSIHALTNSELLALRVRINHFDRTSDTTRGALFVLHT